jgi:hypothetical protein
MTLFGGGKRWETCKRELLSALSGLPNSAEIFVILFSDVTAEPPGQTGWMKARPEWTKNVADWTSAIQPGGGTLPKAAFEKVFSLGERPDAIYFLTDGQFSDISSVDLKKLCGSGGPLNLQAFGPSLRPFLAAGEILERIRKMRCRP